ncbi:MAG: IS91 family transposase [Desulfobacterales bacterium]
MSRPRYEVADVFRQYGDGYCRHYSISPGQLKVLNLLKACRTAALGGHIEQCDHCGHERPAYNSCRNRHCPKCQIMAKEQWLNNRRAELLPCGYFHKVFTLPHDLNPLILCNKKQLLGLIFEAVNEALTLFAKDPQWRLTGKTGFIGVLHTWSQTLMDHFHLHCLIPAGVLSFDENRWQASRKKFLFKITSLAKAFKRIYLQKLIGLYKKEELQFPGKSECFQSPDGFYRLVAKVRRKDWIAYAKRPFAGPEQVLEYLGRYTHRIAISNHRILDIQNGKITFSYRDRSDKNRKKWMTLEAKEFIRRFLMHVLPDGFVKIRYFGFLAHRNKNRCIPLIRSLIDPHAEPPKKIEETVLEIMFRVTGMDITCCPACKKGKMRPIRGIEKPEICDSS